MGEDDWREDQTHKEEEKMMKVDLLPPPPRNSLVGGALSSNAGKPFWEGGVIGLCRQLLSCGNFILFNCLDNKNVSYPTIIKAMPSRLLTSSAVTSLQLGTYETLIRKVRIGNGGNPLTLYQEVCCGLTTGAVVACVATPPILAASRMAAQAAPTDVLLNLYRRAGENGVLSLWKGGGIFSNVLVMWNMGMLVSYNRSFNYFRNSLGLKQDEAVIGAGMVSTFCASACSKPFMFVHHVKYLRGSDGSMRFSNLSALLIAFRLFKNGGPLPFFTGFSSYWWKTAPSILITWLLLQDLRNVGNKKTGPTS